MFVTFLKLNIFTPFQFDSRSSSRSEERVLPVLPEHPEPTTEPTEHQGHRSAGMDVHLSRLPVQVLVEVPGARSKFRVWAAAAATEQLQTTICQQLRSWEFCLCRAQSQGQENLSEAHIEKSEENQRCKCTGKFDKVVYFVFWIKILECFCSKVSPKNQLGTALISDLLLQKPWRLTSRRLCFSTFHETGVFNKPTVISKKKGNPVVYPITAAWIHCNVNNFCLLCWEIKITLFIIGCFRMWTSTFWSGQWSSGTVSYLCSSLASIPVGILSGSRVRL